MLFPSHDLSVTIACPLEPSAFGSLNATSADVGAEVGELSETTLPPECFSDILLIYAASNAATFVSNTSILATVSCNAAVSKGTSLE